MIVEGRPVECRNCGTTITKPRAGQTCCSRLCRAHLTKRNRQRRRQQPAINRACSWCSTSFEPNTPNQSFCSTECRRADDNFFKTHGGPVLKAAMAVRYMGRKGSISDLWQAVRKAYQEMNKRKQTPIDKDINT